MMGADDPSLDGEEQHLSEGDQALSDADQSSADLDQTASDIDGRSSARDQRSADRDQRSADLDQAASDRAYAGGLRSVHYERTRRARSETTLDRDGTAHARSETARIRDDSADRRDREAEARDALADARDELAEAFDAEIDQLERSRPSDGGSSVGLDILLRAAQDRKHAATIRAKAAAARQAASRERTAARQDRIRAAADRRTAAEELTQEGVDFLTGALRRGVGLAAIERELDRTKRSGEELVIAFVDVDGLKAVNDDLGHKAGDELLQTVADRVRHGLRPYDVVMRYGGDEFVCSVSGQDLAGIRIRFDQIAGQVAAVHHGAGISVGLAEATADTSLDELIAQADHAMFELRRHA